MDQNHPLSSCAQIEVPSLEIMINEQQIQIHQELSSPTAKLSYQQGLESFNKFVISFQESNFSSSSKTSFSRLKMLQIKFCKLIPKLISSPPSKFGQKPQNFEVVGTIRKSEITFSNIQLGLVLHNRNQQTQRIQLLQLCQAFKLSNIQKMYSIQDALKCPPKPLIKNSQVFSRSFQNKILFYSLK